MEEPTAKRIRKTSTGSENNTVESYENPMGSNIYLNYDILRIVFTYLNVEDLGRAAMVCRFWLQAANHEKYTRGPDCFIEHHLHFTDKTRFIEKLRIKPTIGFFFIPYETLYGIHETPIPNQDESTCFIFLSNDMCNEVTHFSKHWPEVMQRYRRIDRIPSVWGGVMKWPLSTGCFRFVLITGSIQSWSVVVDGRTEEQVTKKLRLFKNQVKLKKHSVGFIFSCKNMHQKPEMDATIFKTLFPEVPLVGCFGHKAIGKNTMLIDEMDNEMGSRRDWEIDEQTTTFMLLTYG